MNDFGNKFAFIIYGTLAHASTFSIGIARRIKGLSRHAVTPLEQLVRAKAACGALNCESSPPPIHSKVTTM